MNNCHKIVADFNCYGNVQKQQTKWLHYTKIEHIKKYGYYLC